MASNLFVWGLFSTLKHNYSLIRISIILFSDSVYAQTIGETHVKSASGNENLAYKEIQEGPYLVKRTSDTFDIGKKPVNHNTTKLVWLLASEIS